MKHLLRTLLITAITMATRSARAQLTQFGPLSSATGGVNASIGTVGWGGTGNTVSVDNIFATASVPGILSVRTTNYLTITNLGFTGIPNLSTISGVTVSITRAASTLIAINGTVSDNDIRLIKGGALVSGSGPTVNHAAGGNWPFGTLNEAAASYGSNSDLWGTTLVPSDINTNAGFGVAISASLSSVLSIPLTANIDQVTVTVFANTGGTLPIALQSFSAKSAGNGNSLAWVASSNEQTSSFQVQRSSDGQTWQDLATIAAVKGQDDYSYTDPNPLPGADSYRLIMFDADGNKTYSTIQVIARQSLATVRFYPNPFVDAINISSASSFSKVTLTDMQGKTILAKEYAGGVTNAQLPASGLPAGIYFLQVDGVNYKIVKN